METTLVRDNSCSIFSNISLVKIEVNIQVYLEAFSGTPTIIGGSRFEIIYNNKPLRTNERFYSGAEKNTW